MDCIWWDILNNLLIFINFVINFGYFMSSRLFISAGNSLQDDGVSFPRWSIETAAAAWRWCQEGTVYSFNHCSSLSTNCFTVLLWWFFSRILGTNVSESPTSCHTFDGLWRELFLLYLRAICYTSALRHIGLIVELVAANTMLSYSLGAGLIGAAWDNNLALQLA